MERRSLRERSNGNKERSGTPFRYHRAIRNSEFVQTDKCGILRIMTMMDSCCSRCCRGEVGTGSWLGTVNRHVLEISGSNRLIVGKTERHCENEVNLNSTSTSSILTI